MPDAAMTELETQRNEIVAAMQRMAEADPEPGEVRVGDIVQKGDDDLDAPMIVSGIKGAGVIYIYDTRTGERSRTNRNMIPTQLSKKRPDGSTVFTMTPPGITPVRGQLQCLLHPDLRTEHPEYDQWGLAPCYKSNLPSPQEVKNHMEKRHKREWATIENDRLEREKAEDRLLQRQSAEATMAALKAAVGRTEKSKKE